jgi:hypothetical protein
MIFLRLWTWFWPSVKAFLVKPSPQRYGYIRNSVVPSAGRFAACRDT